MLNKKRLLIYTLSLIILPFVTCIVLFLYAPYMLYAPIASFIYQTQSAIPRLVGNDVKFEYITNPFSPQKNGDKVENYLYNSTNQQLFNGTEGPNYYIGFLELKDEVHNSNDYILLMRDIKQKNVVKRFRIVIPNQDSGELKNEEAFTIATVIGLEQYSSLERAQNRLAILNTYGIVASKSGWELFSKLIQGDMVIITFLGCDISTGEYCQKDTAGNIIALGAYKRVGIKK